MSACRTSSGWQQNLKRSSHHYHQQRIETEIISGINHAFYTSNFYGTKVFNENDEYLNPNGK